MHYYRGVATKKYAGVWIQILTDCGKVGNLLEPSSPFTTLKTVCNGAKRCVDASVTSEVTEWDKHIRLGIRSSSSGLFNPPNSRLSHHWFQAQGRPFLYLLSG